MNFKLGKSENIDIILVFENDNFTEKDNDYYCFIKEKELFTGKIQEVYSHISPSNNGTIFLGIGKREDLSLETLRKSFFSLGKEIIKQKICSINLNIPKFDNLNYKDTVVSIVEGILQSEYSFEKYLSKKKLSPCLKDVFLSVPDGEDFNINDAIDEAKILIDGIFLARDLVNEPAINMYPEILSQCAKNELENLGVSVSILEKNEIEKLCMHAFLAVSEGSEKEPKFIVMSYNGNPQSNEKIALVGKGITYDSGGYCIKPPQSMERMHSDMAGSASVIGTMQAIAKSKLKKNVVGLIAACENMISGKSYKTGDIISSMSTKTIEVGNTDAEGRLTLADALYYAASIEKASKIIDIATLTGACVTALGHVYSGAITNDQKLMSMIKEASYLAGEPLWELPYDKEFKKDYKGTFADFINTTKNGAGTIVAGMFLSEFVESIPWVHLDIAGTSYNSTPRSYLPAGASGTPVKTLYYFIKNL